MSALKIHPSLQREVPEFLVDSIVYCDNVTFKRNEQSCFILAKNLKFYEFQKKQLLNCIDLSETCISKLKQEIFLYDGRKCKLSADFEGNETLNHSTAETKTDTNITIGKYVYRHFEIRKFYLLLKCWNIFCVFIRNPTDGLEHVAEYESVLNFKIIANPCIKYQALVRIQFEDESVICTNFQVSVSENNFDRSSVKTSSEFKHLHDRVRTTKAELQLHKEITHKRFQQLYDTQHFGNNLMRSTKIEEKPMLARCGDVWIRITANDEVVLGLPLVNNCAPPNLTVLNDLQPILNINEENPLKTQDLKHFHFQHRIYQLCEIFENLDSLENFLQSQDVNFQENMWAPAKELPPNSFIVMLIKLKISQLILIKEKFQLYVRFMVKKELEITETKIHTFEQHIFIKTFDFQQTLQQRLKYEINFNEHTLHQDLLAIIMTSDATKLTIEFATHNDLVKFEHLLANKFELKKVDCSASTDNHTHTTCNTTAMEVNESFNNAVNLTGNLFYNNQSNSLWFGSLAQRRALPDTTTTLNEDPVPTDWIFYNKNEEKSFLMLKLLFDDLISVKCNILSVKQCGFNADLNSKFVCFENAIREELNWFSNICQDTDLKKLRERSKILAEYQFNTDRLAAEIK